MVGCLSVLGARGFVRASYPCVSQCCMRSFMPDLLSSLSLLSLTLPAVVWSARVVVSLLPKEDNPATKQESQSFF